MNPFIVQSISYIHFLKYLLSSDFLIKFDLANPIKALFKVDSFKSNLNLSCLNVKPGFSII